MARLATVQVPATAPPNQDVSGNMVRYEGRNMLDGVAQTCWRMIGDGTGKEITLTLEKPTRLTTVGLINGYAKIARDGRGKALDWYHGNRRVLTVEWTFDDGTTVTQDLADTNAAADRRRGSGDDADRAAEAGLGQRAGHRTGRPQQHRDQRRVAGRQPRLSGPGLRPAGPAPRRPSPRRRR